MFPVRKVGLKPVQGCTTNAKVVLEARENFMVYCVKSCRKIQKQEHRNFAIIEGSEKIVEYAEKNSLKLHLSSFKSPDYDHSSFVYLYLTY